MSPAPTSRMGDSTREVLDYVEAHPGCTRKEAAAALPHNKAVRSAFVNLVNAGYIQSHAGRGQEGHYVAARAARQRLPSRAAPPVAESATAASSAAPRVGLADSWAEPYLSDVGVRKEGLQFRDCPSRRGAMLVYCYRRPAP